MDFPSFAVVQPYLQVFDVKIQNNKKCIQLPAIENEKIFERNCLTPPIIGQSPNRGNINLSQFIQNTNEGTNKESFDLVNEAWIETVRHFNFLTFLSNFE